MSGYDPTDLRVQERDTTESKDEERARRATEVGDIKWLMSHPQGRRFMWRLLGEAGVYRLTWRPSQKEQDFLEGMRNLGLKYVTEIHELCPAMYELMKQEQRKDASSRHRDVADQ